MDFVDKELPFMDATTLGSALSILLLLYATYQWLLPRPIPGIIYNIKSSRRLLGDAPDMINEVKVTRELNVWMVKQIKRLQSPICQVFITPFAQPWVLLADSVEAQDIMTRRPEFDRSDFITDGLSPMDGFHARMKTGPEWRASRTWLQDLIGPSFLNNRVGPIMFDNSVRLVDFWKTKVRLAEGRPFDANEELNHCALDGMLSFIFDQNFEHTAIGPQAQLLSHLSPSDIQVGSNGEAKFPVAPFNEFITALYDSVETIEKVTKSMAPRFAMWCIRQFPAHKKITEVKRRVVREQVQDALVRLGATGEPKAAIEYMLMREKKSAEKQGRNPEYENPILYDEIAGHFIAGLHTTSTTLAWTFIYLTRYPDIQEKLLFSLQNAYSTAHLDKRAPTVSELIKTRVPYLEAVLEEALRLHATSVARQALCDTEVLGQRIPKGTNVILIANGPGFHEPSFKVGPELRSTTAKPNNWDETRDLSVFDPERWLVYKEGESEAEFDANAAPQIAFGMGPRSCWGRRLAYLEMRMITTLVLWEFDLLPVSEPLADPKASYGIVHRADQCFLKLRSRN